MRASAARAVRHRGMKKEWASWASSCSEARCTARASCSMSWQAVTSVRSTPAAAWWLGTLRWSPLQGMAGSGHQSVKGVGSTAAATAASDEASSLLHNMQHA